MNNKEIYYINKYNSTNKTIGYNLTNGGDGGNTYRYKTELELNIIKNKISKANSGLNNGNHKSIKCYNIVSNQLLKFNTLTDCLKYFNIKSKHMITNICNNKAKYYFRNQWTFAYISNEFNLNLKIRTRFNWRDKYNKCVSTIPDECKGVESEISTDSERGAN